MRYASSFSMSVLLVVVAAVSATEVATLAQNRGASTRKAKAGSTYAAPRTVDGQPDLQGVWANNAGTPLERPKVVADKATLTDEELTAVQKQAAKISDECGDAVFGDSVFTAALGGITKFKSTCGETGNYNHFWLATRWFDNRTSLIIDPPDGRLPPYTAEAQKRQEDTAARRKEHPADGPEDRNLFERCLMPGDMPNLLAGYNANFQIYQSADNVVIHREMIHDFRVIPLDGRPHLNPNLRQLLGDARGRWEGDILVVETTNFSSLSNLRGASSNLRLVERVARIAPDTLQYEFTATDPTTLTKSWTARLLLKLSKDKMYEYACHEGNLGLRGILAGAREQEKRDPSNASVTPR